MMDSIWQYAHGFFPAKRPASAANSYIYDKMGLLENWF
jgi:hypothetical protein